MTEPESAPPALVAPIAGFWVRSCAFLLDSVVLGAFGWAIALVFRDPLVAAGGWALVGGLAVAVAYFAVLDSRPQGTVGKRLLKLRVVDSRGLPLSLPAAGFRCLVLELPHFLNGAPLPAALAESPAASWGQIFVVFGWGGAAAYLYLFNRTTRQSLHDLAAGSYVVVASGEPAPPSARRIPRLHLVVAGAWVLLIVAWIGAMGLRSLGAPSQNAVEVERRRAVQRGVLELPGVTRVTVSDDSLGAAAGRPSRYQLQVFLTRWTEDLEGLGRRVVLAALAAGLACEGGDTVSVNFTRGFSMGIAGGWRHESVVHTCEEWQDEATIRSGAGLGATRVR